MLPHFSGSGTPWFDTASRGAILGLTFSTRKADIAKAILEGLTCELRVNLDLLRKAACRSIPCAPSVVEPNLICGLQMKADITGIPVVAPQITEASGLGAAVLAGVGAGIYPDASRAIEGILRFRREFLPDPQRQQAYERQFALYKQVYPAIKPITHLM